MNRQQFQTLVRTRPVLLDGATGTELFKRGLPPGAMPEKWVLDNPSVIMDLHREYYAAGSDIVLTCTFGLTRVKLADHGLAGAVRDMNARLAEISRAVVPEGRFLFGDMSPTGRLVEPFGPFAFEEAVAVYREQARALRDGGVDGFMIETMMDIQETRAAIMGAREAAPDLPIIAGMTYEKSGRTLGGTPPEAALVTLQSIGADAVGCNCSRGPEEMLPLLAEMLPYARVPLFIKPNAGMPTLKNGKESYDLGAEAFADAVMRGFAMGAGLAGGCCGTTPAHIKAVRERLASGSDTMCPVARSEPPRAAVSSSRGVADFSGREGLRRSLVVVGERINPTGKKKFQAELLAGDFNRILEFADEQAAAGADLLDVNLGLGGLDEPAALRQAVAMLAPATDLPLCIDTVRPEAMEAALRLYPGRALVNSVSGEKSRLEGILPLAAKYGAMIIVLPVAEGHIPLTPAERLTVAREIIAAAEKHGLTLDDMIVDGLAMTVSADPAAGRATLNFIGACADAGLRTILGLSNVSFGMPERKWLNAVFMAMAVGRGLTAVIANPSSELLMEAKTAADALHHRHEGVARHISRFAGEKDALAKTPAQAEAVESPVDKAAQAVLKGHVKQAGPAAAAAVAAGVKAGDLVSGHLVPAIVQAGELFEKNVYFLPQLMNSGEAMRLALEAIEPELAKERQTGGGAARGRIVLATVKGDVHDIGKNLVTLMLRNNGFEVFDLGKDVAPAAIAEAVRKYKADILGLSALMTTTLAAMREAISHIRRAGLDVKIMVGGAAVTPHFAEEAGADGVSSDAVSAVKLASYFMDGAKDGFAAL